jgi:hypothetical protein
LFKKRFGPPDAASVMLRALALKYQVVEGLATPPPDQLPGILESWGASERESFLENARKHKAEAEKRLRESGIWAEMTSAEREFIQTLPTEISPQMLINVSWMMEAAECLLWALGYVQALPPYDEQADRDHLELLPSTSVRELRKAATLRDKTLVDSAREAAELWHWRSRTRQLEESGRSIEMPEGQTFAQIIEEAAEWGAKEGLFDAPIDGDFPAFGRAYRDISAEEWACATSIAMERHKALNWLCGMAPSNRWEDTPTDT